MRNPKYKWNIEDAIKLSIVNSNYLNHSDIFDIYPSFEDFQQKTLSKYYPSYENKLFDNDTQDFKRESSEILEQCEKNNISVVSIFEDEYPSLLKEIANPPVVLYYRGNLKDNGKRISIVGTRRCTEYGKLCAELFTEAFVKAEVSIVSGLAIGIDTFSHLCALKNKGKTFAVIACGIDKISPQTSEMNADKIVQSGGAIISTYPPGVTALPPYFLQRNRIISGLSQASLIIESGFKGGSLNTARNANEQNREVYAVPGRINSERSKGTNRLIWQNGAKIAINPEEILDDLGFKCETELFSEANSAFKNLSENQKLLLKHIDSEPSNVDSLAEATSLSIAEILSELLYLEIGGFVKQIPGNNYIKFNI